jgi:quinol monooxygenase YgiN
MALLMPSLPILISHAKKKGCLKFEVTQSAKHNNIFTVYEELVDKAAFQRHQERVRDSAWRRVSANAERHYEMGEKS